MDDLERERLRLEEAIEREREERERLNDIERKKRQSNEKLATRGHVTALQD